MVDINGKQILESANFLVEEKRPNPNENWL